MSKKLVLKLDLHDDRVKQKAMSRVSGLQGVNSLSVDMKSQKLTITGDVDPVLVISKLRKLCYADIVTVEAVKQDEKKEEKPQAKKTQDEKKKDPNDVSELVQAYKTYNPHFTTYYHVTSAEEDPNACVIC